MPSDLTRPERPPEPGAVPPAVRKLAEALNVTVRVWLYPNGARGGHDALWMFSAGGREVGSWVERTRLVRVFGRREKCKTACAAVRAVWGAVQATGKGQGRQAA